MGSGISCVGYYTPNFKIIMGKIRITNEQRLEKARKKILEKIAFINEDKSRDIEFLGIVDEKWITDSKTRLKLRDNKNNEEGTISYASFIKTLHGWYSHTEKGEAMKFTRDMTEKDALMMIDKRLKFDNEIEGRSVSFLGFVGKYENSRTKVKIKNELTEETTEIECIVFIYQGWLGNESRNEQCKENGANAMIPEEEALSTINNLIEKMNENPYTDLTFLGYKGGKWVGQVTKLIIRCNIHNEICYPYYFSFVAKTRYFCPQCMRLNLNKFVSNGEQACLDIVKDLFPEQEIETQFFVKNEKFKDLLPSYKGFYVDIYIPGLNAMIEYDGGAHYKYIHYFYKHKGYQGYINQVNRDRCLEKYCDTHCIRLLRISFKDDKRLEEVIKDFLINGIDSSTKVDPILLPSLIY